MNILTDRATFDLDHVSVFLQEDQQELDVEYNKACGEMLDQSLITVVQESHRDLINEQVIKERLINE